jgi:hypothetical protein
MTTHTRIATTLAAVIALAAPAAADAKLQKAYFSVTLTGTQETRWSSHEESVTDGCGSVLDASGSETVRFRSTRAASLRVVKFPGVRTPEFGLPATEIGGTVTRQAKSAGAYVGDCFGGDDVGQGDGTGGDEEPPQAAQTCGTARFSDLTVPLDFERKVGHVELGEDTFTPLDPLPDCEVEGPAFFPTLLSSSGGKPIRSEIPYSDLLDRRLRKHIVLGGGKETRALPGGRATTKIRWELVFRRVKAPRGR